MEIDFLKSLSTLLNGAQVLWPCRLCLKRPEGNNTTWSHLDRSLRIDSLKTTTTLRTIINSLMNTQMDQCLSLPQDVCESCADAATRVFLFRQLCEQSEEQWIKLVRLTNGLYEKTEALNGEMSDPDWKDITSIVYILKDKAWSEIISPIDMNIDTVSQYLNRIAQAKSDCLSNEHSDSDAKKKKYKKRKPKKSNSAEYRCHKCNKKLVCAVNLERHMFSCKLHVCLKCGRRYPRPSQLRYHLETCQKERKPRTKYPPATATLICDYCGYRYHTKHSLEIHITTKHLFPQKYICNICERRFNQISNLRRHHTVHTRERPEQCDVCGLRVVTKPALINHMRLHSGERPFSCEECDEKFLSASRRQEHVRKKHWGRTEVCSICFRMFYTPFAMRVHRKRHFNPNSNLFIKKVAQQSIEMV